MLVVAAASEEGAARDHGDRHAEDEAERGGAYGDRVFIIEYRQQDFDQGCSDYPGLSIVLRDLDVSTPSSGSYVYDGC